MAVDLDLDHDQQMLAEAVQRAIVQREGARSGLAAAAFDAQLWRELADIGLWALAGEFDAEGRCGLIVAACESLGAAGVAGPVAATLLACAVLPEPLVQEVRAGSQLVALGQRELMPWGEDAQVFIECGADALHLFEVTAREPVDSLGGERCARVQGRRGAALAGQVEALHVHDLGLAAYLGAAGRRLVEDAAAHAAQRRQFGKTLGTFQGVAFPLADAVSSVDAVQTLVRIAAFKADQGDPAAAQLANAARLVAGRAALRAARSSQQAYGALGMLEDGPVFWLSRRIQQWQLQAPSEAQARERLDAGTVSAGFLLGA